MRFADGQCLQRVSLFAHQYKCELEPQLYIRYYFFICKNQVLNMMVAKGCNDRTILATAAESGSERTFEAVFLAIREAITDEQVWHG